MNSDVILVDVSSVPELAHLAKEVAEDGRSRILRADGANLAIVSPARKRRQDQGTAAHLPRLPKRSVVAATAGSVRYDGPVLTVEEESEAFERGVADEIVKSMED
jgi:hypothetical protein